MRRRSCHHVSPSERAARRVVVGTVLLAKWRGLWRGWLLAFSRFKREAEGRRGRGACELLKQGGQHLDGLPVHEVGAPVFICGTWRGTAVGRARIHQATQADRFTHTGRKVLPQGQRAQACMQEDQDGRCRGWPVAHRTCSACSGCDPGVLDSGRADLSEVVHARMRASAVRR